MTGPEHFVEAERLAAEAARLRPSDRDEQITLLMRAQVDATLALAAAVAMGANHNVLDASAWHDVAATQL